MESLVRALPAEDRGALEWFPVEFRARVVQPLVEQASEELSLRLVDELAVPAGELLARLGSCVASLFVRDPAFAQLLANPGLFRLDARAETRLRRSHPKAAEDLAAAVDWLGAILSAVLGDYRNSVAHGFAARGKLEIDAVALRRELDGPLGYLVRGSFLASAATDVALTRDALPPAIDAWCGLALVELQAAANVLRGQGLRVPTALRSHDASSILRGGLLPPGFLERIVAQFNPQEVWLFGSRAKGTHSPLSDYDVFVVLDDVADVERITSWANIAPLRRARVDLIAVTRSEFEDSKDVRGTLSNVVAEEGRRLYER